MNTKKIVGGFLLGASLFSVIFLVVYFGGFFKEMSSNSQNLEKKILVENPSVQDAVGKKQGTVNVQGSPLSMEITQRGVSTGFSDGEIVYIGKNYQGAHMVQNLTEDSSHGLIGTTGYDLVSVLQPDQYIDYLAFVKKGSFFVYNVRSMEMNKIKDITWGQGESVVAYPSSMLDGKMYVSVVDISTKKVTKGAYIINLEQKSIQKVVNEGILNACAFFDSLEQQLIQWKCGDAESILPIRAVNGVTGKMEQAVLFEKFVNEGATHSSMLWPYFVFVSKNNQEESSISFVDVRDTDKAQNVVMTKEMSKRIKADYSAQGELFGSFVGNIVGINRPYKTLVIADKKGNMRLYRYDEQGFVNAVGIWENWDFVKISQNKVYYKDDKGFESYINLEDWYPNGYTK